MISPIGRSPNRAGYTLIELVLLTIIIAILVAVSTPLFRRTFSDLELRDASFNMARLISFAQEKAVIEGLSYKLILDADEAEYYLAKSDPTAPEKHTRLKERFGRTFSLPRNTKLKSDRKEINFYPDGHSDKAVITLISPKKSLKIKLKGKLGYVEIEGDDKE